MTDNFFNKHKEIYLLEAQANLDEVANLLLDLEKNFNQESLQKIFRLVHSLKGNAATMQYEQTANVCHAIEDLLTAVKDNRVSIEASSDILFKTIDSLNYTLQALAREQAEPDLQPMVSMIQQLLAKPKETVEYQKTAKKTLTPTIERIRVINVRVEHLDSLMKLSEELLVNRLKLNSLSERINSKELNDTVDTLERLVTELQYNIMQARLLPLKVIFARFPRMIRDLAKDQKKEVVLQIVGSDIELDRALLDDLAEALIHLIRNAVDHGIESVEERIKANKSVQGTIQLSATRTKEYVTIELSDDGKGLDWQAIKSAGLRKQMITPSADHSELLQLLFKGISTNQEVTEISGRGLGLAIAKQKIDSIGGSFALQSKLGSGMTISMRIPLTLAVIKVLFIKVNDKTYAIPLDNIERLLSVSEDQLHEIFNHKAIVLHGESIHTIYLAELFSEPVQVAARKPIIIVNYAGKKLAICVDYLLSTEEVVIKPLSKLVKVNRLFSGSALVGSGDVVLIIDVAHLLSGPNAATRSRPNVSI